MFKHKVFIINRVCGKRISLRAWFISESQYRCRLRFFTKPVKYIILLLLRSSKPGTKRLENTCETSSHGGEAKFIIIFPKKRIKNTSNLYFEKTPSKHEPGTPNQTETDKKKHKSFTAQSRSHTVEGDKSPPSKTSGTGWTSRRKVERKVVQYVDHLSRNWSYWRSTDGWKKAGGTLPSVNIPRPSDWQWILVSDSRVSARYLSTILEPS